MNYANKSLEIHASPAVTTSAPPLLLALSFSWLCVLPFALAWDLARVLFKLELENDTFSQIPLIPFVSLFLIDGSRRAIFSQISSEGSAEPP